MRMRKNQAKYRLEPTAAMVMLWARELYRKGLPKRYLATLDLGAAEKVLEQCHKVCPWYGEIILDRKYLIKHLAQDRLRSAKKPQRVIILGAGKSPLSLELLANRAFAPDQIIEVDTRGLSVKKRIFKKIAPAISEKIDFVSADITSPKAGRVYKAAAESPSIIILEGLSYYISVRKFKKMLRIFRSKDLGNLLIVEYLLPFTCVAEEKRFIPRAILSTARRIGGLRALTHYTGDKIRKIIAAAGGKPERRFTVKDMERLRTGKNRYFKRHNEGWIECFTARI